MSVEQSRALDAATHAPKEAERSRFVRLKEAAFVTCGSVVGAMVGGIVAYNTPTETPIIPGVDTESKLELGRQSLDVNGYALGQLSAPNAHVSDHFGLHINVKNINLPIDSDTASLVAGAIAQPPKGAVREALIDHIISGAQLGVFAVGSLSIATIAFLRHKNRKSRIDSQTDAVITAVKANQSVSPELHEKIDRLESLRSHDKHKRTRLKLPAIAMAGLALIAAGTTGTPPESSSQQSTKLVAELYPDLGETYPALRGATVSGTGGILANKLAKEVFRVLNRANETWTKGADNTASVAEAFEQNGGLDYLGDEQLRPLLIIGDDHCNKAFSSTVFPVIIKYFRTNTILSAGDTWNTMNNKDPERSPVIPLEDNCLQNLVDAMKNVEKETGMQLSMVRVNGNHDPKKLVKIEEAAENGQQHILVDTLGEGHRSTVVNNVPIVGAASTNDTLMGPTLPLGIEEQNEGLVAEGEKAAEEACKVADETGARPLLLAHEPLLSWPAIKTGCVSQAYNAHQHEATLPLRYLGKNNQITTQQTVGTASGANGGIMYYAAPGRAANAKIAVYDTRSKAIVEYIDWTMDIDGSVTITEEEPLGDIFPAEDFASRTSLENPEELTP